MAEKLNPNAKDVLDKIAAYQDFDSRSKEDWKHVDDETAELEAALADIFEEAKPEPPML